jgi:hypothetical protein
MAQYTPEQLTILTALPSEVMMAAMLADLSGPIAAFREVAAGMKFINEAKIRFPTNQLIQGVSQDPASASSHGQHLELSTPEEIEAGKVELQRRIDQALSLLANDAEAQEFKEFLVHIAEQVVSAAGTGLFGSGVKVSEAEARFVDFLKHHLGLV